MNIGDLRDDWALVVAIPLLGIVGLIVLYQLFQRSPRGQLRTNVANVVRTKKDHRRAGAAVVRAEKRLAKMEQRLCVAIQTFAGSLLLMPT